MFKKVAIAILLSNLSLGCFASSPEAWEEFRTNVKTACEAEIKKNFEIDTIDVDPEGSDSYGIAIATGKEKGVEGVVTQVCIFDKVSEKVELGSVLQRAIDNSIDINVGENPQLDNCLDKAMTSLDMNDCRTKYEVKG